MFRKTMTVAVAVAAVAAVAVPAGAMAGVWKHHGQAIQENQEVALTGQHKSQAVGLGFIECQVTSSMTLKAGQSTGTIDLFHPLIPITDKCSTGGFLVGCQVHSAEPTGMPWTVHNETQRIEITAGAIHYTMTGGFCAAKRVTKTPVDPSKNHTITWTPNQTKTITSFTESGEGEEHLYSQHQGEQPFRTGTVITQGTLTMSASDKHTYSLE